MQNKIYTSYFGKIKKLPKNIIPIAICGKPPVWWKGLQYSKLAPKIGFFLQWKRTHDNNYYIQHFNTEVLDILNADNVIHELKTMSNGQDIALLCYEKPEDFCHRHLVAAWLNKNGYEVSEYAE